MYSTRTTVYHLRAEYTADGDTALDALVAAAPGVVQDSHISRDVRRVSVGFRIPSDVHAAAAAAEAMLNAASLTGPAFLLTGHGVHRRIVWERPAG